MAILKGSLGFKGEHGDSAYELAVKNGYEGTEEEWIEHFGLDLSTYLKGSDVVDNLTSSYTTRPLSANQGKQLDTAKQDKLVSGTNIKTINNNSLLGTGNINLLSSSEIGDVADLETTASTVVGAINENKESITTVDNKFADMFYWESVIVAEDITVNANYAPPTEIYTLHPKEGYTPIMAVPQNTYNGKVNFWFIDLTNENTVRWRIMNVGTSNVTGIYVFVRVLYARTDLVMTEQTE